MSGRGSQVEELTDPLVKLRHDGGLADVDVLRVVEDRDPSAIAGKLAPVVLGVVVHVALHPVTAEPTVRGPSSAGR